MEPENISATISPQSPDVQRSDGASRTARTSSVFAIPLSIIIAGAMIAGAVIYTNGRPSGLENAPVGARQAAAPQPSGSTDAVRPIGKEDHIRGNPNAPVKIVEYSDYECPFCKRFHPTMRRVMDEYGKKGQVAWVYRHFPLEQLHPVKARAEAVASECVNELGGNEAFWQFTDRFFELTPSNNRTDIETVIPQIIAEIGLDAQKFEACTKSGRYDAHIDDDIRNALETGGRGTPWSIVIAPNGKTFPLSGAQPYAAVRQLIEIALAQQ